MNCYAAPNNHSSNDGNCLTLAPLVNETEATPEAFGRSGRTLYRHISGAGAKQAAAQMLCQLYSRPFAAVPSMDLKDTDGHARCLDVDNSANQVSRSS
jgi:hypothetical protein